MADATAVHTPRREIAVKHDSDGHKSTKAVIGPVSERRLKKREIDRRCQRLSRERTKAQIEALNNQVEELKAAHADGQAAYWMKKYEDAQKEKDKLQQKLDDVHKALGPPDAPVEKKHGYGNPRQDNTSSPPLVRGTQAMPPSTIRTNSDESIHTNTRKSSLKSSSLEDPDPSSATSLNGVSLANEPVESTGAPLNEPIVPKVCNDGCDCCQNRQHPGNGQPGNLWRYANTTLLTPYQNQSIIAPEEDFLAEDIPVRIVLDGWEALEQQMEIPFAWQILRGIDNNLFSQCPPVVRLAVLTTMHTLLQSHRDPTPERRAKLPPWYLRRPSSEVQKHSYAINFFVWPGLRERFVFQQHKYCANIFWELFATSLNINWAYDFRDCFAQRWDTQTYEISPLFRSCISEIGNWQMRGDLFERFPELRCDIPATLQSARPMSNVLQMQMANKFTPTYGRVLEESQPDRRHGTGLDFWNPQSFNIFPYGVQNHSAVTPWAGSQWIT